MASRRVKRLTDEIKGLRADLDQKTKDQVLSEMSRNTHERKFYNISKRYRRSIKFNKDLIRCIRESKDKEEILSVLEKEFGVKRGKSVIRSIKDILDEKNTKNSDSDTEER